MDARLRVVAGAKEAAIRLKLPTTIGRGEQASLKVPQSQVSREHCEVYEEDGMLVVDDLGSSNGTFVNDERIEEPTFLYPDELLRVGKVVLQAEYEVAGGILPNAPESDATDLLPESVRKSQSEQADDCAELDPTDVLNDDNARPSSTSSVVKYRETAEGSFIGIEEWGADPPDSDAEGVSRVAFDVDDPRPPRVDEADSALNEFFKKIE